MGTFFGGGRLEVETLVSQLWGQAMGHDLAGLLSLQPPPSGLELCSSGISTSSSRLMEATSLRGEVVLKGKPLS